MPPSLFYSCFVAVGINCITQTRYGAGEFTTVGRRWISAPAHVADVNTPALISKKLEVVWSIINLAVGDSL